MLISKREDIMKIRYIAIILAAILFTGCNKFLDIRPTGVIIARTAADYRALLTEKYSLIPNASSRTDLRTDDMVVDFSKATNTLHENWYFDIWTWSDVTRDKDALYFYWQTFYEVSYIANYIIEHKNEIEEGTKAEINQLVGESYMLRAYMHFLLVNLYAEPYTKCDPESSRGIPLQLDTNIKKILKCSSVATVYRQILSDIASAEEYMNVEKWSEGYTYRFSKITANALRARVALYMGNWQLAYDEALKVIAQHPELEDLTASGYTMPKHYLSKESILALEKEDEYFVNTDDNNKNGFVSASYDLMKVYGVNNPKSNRPTSSIVDYRIKKSPTENDIQGVFFKFKGGGDSTRYFFQPIPRASNDYRCTFRSAEFYLIAAEAANELNDKTNAQKYLTDLTVKRFYVDDYNDKVSKIEMMSQDELRVEILNERRREFAFQGHRWFDLRRTTQPSIDRWYKGVKYATLEENDERYTLRLPVEAVAANPELSIWPY